MKSVTPVLIGISKKQLYQDFHNRWQIHTEMHIIIIFKETGKINISLYEIL